MLRIPYRELLGSLQYLTLISRPDIYVAVNFHSKFQENPSEENFKGLKRILRYLKGTMDLSLTYNANVEQPVITGYSDASYAEDLIDRKSTSGFVYKLFGDTISWSTKRQSTVSESSTEAELLALSYASKEGRWIRNLLQEMKIEMGPIILYEDNIPCINIAEEPRCHQRCKHVDVKYMKIRELIKNKEIELKYICSAEQVADVMTKPLPYNSFKKHINSVGLL